MRKLAMVFASLATVATAAIVSGEGVVACFPQGQCPTTSTPELEYCALVNGVVDPTCRGHLLDPNHWESGPIMGDWVTYGHSANWLMHFRDGTTGAELLGNEPIITAYVSPYQEPNDAATPGGQFAQAAGDLAEFVLRAELGPDGGTTGWNATVLNFTCADYYIYVSVTTTPLASTADASTDTSGDALGDGPTE